MKFSNWIQQEDKATSNQQSVIKEFLPELDALPLVYRANSPSINFISWYQSVQPQLEEELLKYGAILFRGFDVKNDQQFSDLVNIAITNGAQYIEGATPRKQLSDRVYTSTEFPKEQTIEQHNELSYTLTPPSRLAFYCSVAPPVGGETPIADVHKVYQRIPQSLKDKFINKGGWLLRRHYLNGFGPSIYKAMGLETAEQVEHYCQRAKVDLHWDEQQQAITEQVRPVVHKHPTSSLPLWFNHVAFWHPSSLCPKVKESIEASFDSKCYPFNTLYGDGSTISDEDIAIIKDAYKQEEKAFKWHVGDVMLIDNWRVSHGRKPFEGQRRVLVSMG